MTRKFFTCPSCHENSSIKTFAPDRVTLEREKGEKFSTTCSHCGEQSTIHVNKVKAEANHLMTYVVSAFCLIVFLFIIFSGLFMNIWILLAVTSLIGLPVAVRQAVEKAATTFNSYQL